MSAYVPNKQHMREVLLFFFISKKSAAESYRLLLETYGDATPSLSTCEYWFRRFNSGVFDVKDKERPGQPKKIEDADLQALLYGDPCQTQKELAMELNIDRTTVSRRLHALGKKRKLGEDSMHNDKLQKNSE